LANVSLENREFVTEYSVFRKLRFFAKKKRTYWHWKYMKHQWNHSGKMKDRMKLSLPQKLVGKLVCIPVISFRKIFITSYAFDALFSPASRMTLLRITLLCIKSNKELIVSRSPPIDMKVWDNIIRWEMILMQIIGTIIIVNQLKTTISSIPWQCIIELEANLIFKSSTQDPWILECYAKTEITPKRRKKNP
jgi:hypothetical protein